MAREISVEILCDACLARDERTHGDELTVSLNQGGIVSIALCETHDKEILAPLRELLVDAPFAATSQTTQRRDAGRRSALDESDRVRCPFDECQHRKSYENLGSLGGHLRTIHRMSLIETRDRFPQWSNQLPT